MAYKTERLKSRIIERYGEQKSFAKALGVDESTLSRYLSGREWKSSTMMKAVELLEIPLCEIEVYFFDKAVVKRQPQKV